MPYLYLDSSVLVKYHIDERGSSWVRQLLDTTIWPTCATATLSQIEVWSAFNRRIREGTITTAEYDQLVQDFDALCAVRYQLIADSHLDRPSIRSLLERYPLRAADAIQLATALLVQTTLTHASAPGLIFLSADQNLLAAARAEGLAVDNPNLHP